jgi:threonine/homoserine/homoserine lactone efflux protein
MDLTVLPKGMLLGFAIAAPVGPIGLLTIRRTLTDGFRLGIATGLGTATADASYGMVAAFGLTAVTSAMISNANAIRLVGGLMLLSIGLRGVLHATRAGLSAEVGAGRMPTTLGAYVQTIGLTLTNPLTIISFIGMFAGLGITDGRDDLARAIVFVTGVGLGSAAWWFLLCGVTSRLRHRLPSRAIAAINLGSSLIITGFGVAALVAAR